MHKFEELFNNDWKKLQYNLSDLKCIIQNDILIPEEGIEQWKHLVNKFNINFIELSRKTILAVIQNNKEKRNAKMGK